MNALFAYIFTFSIASLNAFFYDSSGSLKEGFLKETWVPMTESEASEYYTRDELRSIFVDRDVDSCFQSPGSLLRHISTMPNSTSFASTLALLLVNNISNIIFLGDSVSLQHLDNISDRLQKLGLKQHRLLDWNINEQNPHYSDLKYNFARSFSISESVWDALHQQCATFHRSHHSHHRNPYHIHHSHNRPNRTHVRSIEGCSVNSTVVDNRVKNLNLIALRLFPSNLPLQLHYLQRILDGSSGISDLHYFKNQSNLIVINYGLFYNTEDKDDYYRHLKSFLPKFVTLAAETNNHFYFRETSAQHFGPPGGGIFPGQMGSRHHDLGRMAGLETVGEYLNKNMFRDSASEPVKVIDKSWESELHIGCFPIQNASEYYLQNWRNRAVHEVLGKVDPHGLIPIIPFFNVTAPRHDYHNGEFHDCTHWCKDLPMLWEPVWGFLYESLSQKLAFC